MDLQIGCIVARDAVVRFGSVLEQFFCEPEPESF